MLQIEHVSKRYTVGGTVQQALDDVSIALRDNEFVAILGPSGSGKTTLLNVIGGLDRYDAGDLVIDGVSTKRYSDRDWDAYRNHSVGFVFQSYNLIAHQSVLANVELALTIGGVKRSERRERARRALEQVGLADHMNKRPNQLSGGQMQRVAIARALVNDPQILLADEPTGALDSETSVAVMELLKQVAADRLVVMVTHNPELAERYATRIVTLQDGKVTSDTSPCTEAEIAAKAQVQMGEKATAAGAGGSRVKWGAKPAKASMSFATALALSFNNLRTKKGRTILTAFAGSIGIIGIALILSLSNGVNTYIANVESDTMGSYPIVLERQAIDLVSAMNAASSATGSSGGMTAMLGSSAASTEVSVSVGGQATDSADGAAAGGDGTLTASNVVGASVEPSMYDSMVKSNDLGKFKTYLDANGSAIQDNVRAVEYDYDVTPLVYRVDDDGAVTKVSPATLADVAGEDLGSSHSASTSWGKLPDDQDMRESTYELLAGTWPTTAGEVALVVDANGQVGDLDLYALGLLDASNLPALVEAAQNGEAYTGDQEAISFEDAIGLTYQAISPSALYAQGDAGSAWIDRSGDADFVADAVAQGTTVKVTCVLRAGKNASVTSGVAYTGALVQQLMDDSAASAVVQAQLADPETNVLTGAPFGQGTLDVEALASGDMSGLLASGMGASMDGFSMGGLSMSEDQISLLMAQAAGTIPTTYEGVLDALGYATADNPVTISLYPDDFASKDAIGTFITNYNASVASESDMVTYTDLVGTMISSVTTIVNAISFVLIAFVAVSLVVSSIMIGIITFISVLERTKEIGILRSLGASKGNVAQVFNAETFIVGLLSGLIGVGVTLLLLVPGNALIHFFAGTSDVSAQLSWVAALALIALSVALTLIGGLVPASKAAGKDPVIALRTE